MVNAALSGWADPEVAAGAPEAKIRDAAAQVDKRRQGASDALTLSQLPLKTLPPLVGLAAHRFDLRGCCRLSDVPAHLGALTALKQLNLTGCTGLKLLPEQLGELTALTELNTMRCTNLTALPKCQIFRAQS